MKKRELVNFKVGPGGNPRIPVRVKIIQTTGEENRKQWEKGIDRMIAYRKKHAYKTYRKVQKHASIGNEVTILKEGMTEEEVKHDFLQIRHPHLNIYFECEQTGIVIDIAYLPTSQEWKFKEICI